MIDFRPITLTSAPMKCVERLMLRRLMAEISSQMDPLQFAYRPGRSVDDATTLCIHSITKHLNMPGTYYVRVLFIYFSSAFNTSILYNKLLAMGVNMSMCNWILD